MDSKKIAEVLRKEFAKVRFFTRIFEYNDKIYIWNDPEIYLKLTKDDYNIFKDDLLGFIDKTIKLFRDTIEKKYEKIKSRKVSVIIPNYNNESFITKTIDSILENTYKDIEIILVDDCSTDKSVEVVRKKYGNNPIIKIYENTKNHGTFYCRNKGILLSTGYYILNVDGDDIIHPEKIDYEVKGLEMKNASTFTYWGYGTGFRRLYHNGDPDKIEKIVNQQNDVLFLTYRKTFNYIGFYHNSRVSADAELFETRALWYGMKFYKDRKKYYYDAYSTAGKNLTRITKRTVIFKYHYDTKMNYVNNVYIKMGFLDDIKEFAEIAFYKNRNFEK